MKQNTSSHHFHANGKLLLSGEYFVLDGALAIAVPTKQGQKLIVEEQESFAHLAWESKEVDGTTWFKGLFSIDDFSIINATDNAVATRLQQILLSTKAQNEDFLKMGAIVETQLEFPREWGLGTSSTLLYNVAQWAGVNAHTLLKDTFGGSGYDLACAGASSAIFYRLKNGEPNFFEFPFQPPFLDKLYFVYLDKKQNSRDGIAHYRNKAKDTGNLIAQISNISEKIAQTSNLSAFESLLREHETLVSETLNIKKVKDLYFSDYWGEVKSLGAWGGDFVLVSSEKSIEETRQYFSKKGYNVLLAYKDLII